MNTNSYDTNKTHTYRCDSLAINEMIYTEILAVHDTKSEERKDGADAKVCNTARIRRNCEPFLEHNYIILNWAKGREGKEVHFVSHGIEWAFLFSLPLYTIQSMCGLCGLVLLKSMAITSTVPQFDIPIAWVSLVCCHAHTVRFWQF